MDLFSELQTALQSDQNVSNNSSLYPPATIKLALNRAYRKAGGLFRWPALEDALMTTSQTNIEYYDAPTNWYPDSMWRLEVDGDAYGEVPDGSPMNYHDYLDWRADSANDNSTEKKWAVQWLRYFIYPVPTTASASICVWGHKVVSTLTNDSDTTIFSYNMPECNEAVVLEAAAILQKKGENEKKGQMFSLEAKELLSIAYNRIRKESAKYEKTQPFFNVPNYYGPNISNNSIGKFDNYDG